MKIRFIYAAAAVTVLAACSKTYVEEQPLHDANPVKLTVDVTSGVTKVTGELMDDQIKSLQLFSFGTNDLLDGYSTVSGSSEISVEVPPSFKLVHILANAPALTDVKNYKDFKSRVSYLENNSPDAMIMEGWISADLRNGDVTLSIPVKRFASRISLISVRNKMELEYYQTVDIKVTKAYLINVAGDMEFTGAFKETIPAPTVWFNKRQDSDELSLLTRSDINASIGYEESYTTPHRLYCYSNPTETDSSEENWSARHTRLVVEAEIEGYTYYYPVTLPVLKQNTDYQVTLTITRTGSTHPDVPYYTNAADVTVTVVDWQDGSDVDAII